MKSIRERQSRLRRQKALKRELRHLKRRAENTSLELSELKVRCRQEKNPLRRDAAQKNAYRVEGELRQLEKKINQLMSQIQDA